MKKQRLLFGLIILLFGFFVLFPLFNKTNKNNHGLQKKEKTEKKLTVFQKLSLKNKPSEFQKITVVSGTTALQLLKQQTQIKTKGEGVAAFVVEIDSITADSKNREYWAFYINAKPATVGAGSYKLNDGDKIEWKIEKY